MQLADHGTLLTQLQTVNFYVCSKDNVVKLPNESVGDMILAK